MTIIATLLKCVIYLIIIVAYPLETENEHSPREAETACSG